MGTIRKTAKATGNSTKKIRRQERVAEIEKRLYKNGSATSNRKFGK